MLNLPARHPGVAGMGIGADLERMVDEHQALRRVAATVAGDVSPEAVFQIVASEVGHLFDSSFAIIRRYEPGGKVRDVAMWTNSKQPYPPLSREAVVLEGRNLSTMVFETGEIAQIDGYDATAGAPGAPAIAAGVRSAVGAPIKVHGRLWGVMISSCKGGAPVTTEVGRRLKAFTELVATAIANAEARDELGRLAEAQSALRRVATLVARSGTPADVFSAVAQEVRDLLAADIAVIVRFEATGDATQVASAGEVDPPAKRQLLHTAELFRRTEGTSLGEPAVQIAQSAVQHGHGRSWSVATPIVVNDQLWGAMGVSTSNHAGPGRLEERLAEFTHLVATAISNAEDRSELLASRARIVASADEARRRIERDLHDGVQQRLVSLALGLRETEVLLPTELADVRDSVTRTVDGLSEILAELREISRGIHPAVLSQGGLGPAIRSLARRSAVPVEVAVRLEGPLPQDVEVAGYYVVAEALANVVKHADAKRVSVEAYADAGVLYLRVEDDGVGGADPRKGLGLLGLSDRAQAVGGTINIESPDGGGTLLLARLPFSS